MIGLSLKIQHTQNLLQLDRILQIRFRTVPVNPHHFIKSDSCKTAVQHNPINLAQILYLPVPLFLLLSTTCPIPPVSLVVLFTSIYIHYFLALAFFTPALHLCSPPLLFAFPPKRFVTHIYVHRRGAKSAQNPRWLPRSRLRSLLLKVTANSSSQIIRYATNVMEQTHYMTNVVEQMLCDKEQTRYATNVMAQML